MKRLLTILAALPPVAWCQAPVVSRVVNSASYQDTWGVPGSIASILGTNLAGTATTAQQVPLPFELGGTTVTVAGHAVPLFYVSPAQINFQVPDGGTFALVVNTAAGSSFPSEPAEDGWYAAGIFTMDASGCDQGAVLDTAADGSPTLNSTGFSASPGDWISVYATGISQIYTDGYGAPLAPLLKAQTQPGVEFDFAGVAQAVSPGWAGLTPGFVGLDQVNVRIPAAVREGCAVPLRLAYGAGISQPVTIAIHNGGGACVDPPVSGFGQIAWQKTVTATNSNAVSESDTLTVSLQASPGQPAPATPVYSDGCPPPGNVCYAGLSTYEALSGPACAVPGYRSLGAGSVTMQGPGLSPAQVPLVPLQPGPVAGLSVYRASLPAGTVQAGNFTVTATGGADVGAFQATAPIGADIQLQTALAGINVFQGCQPLAIDWTGGDPNSWLTVSFVSQMPTSDGASENIVLGDIFRTPTSKGTLTIPVPTMQGTGCGTTVQPIQIVIQIDPDPAEIAPFSAPGLSLGGQVTWRYTHTFQASLYLL